MLSVPRSYLPPLPLTACTTASAAYFPHARKSAQPPTPQTQPQTQPVARLSALLRRGQPPGAARPAATRVPPHPRTLARVRGGRKSESFHAKPRRKNGGTPARNGRNQCRRIVSPGLPALRRDREITAVPSRHRGPGGGSSARCFGAAKGRAAVEIGSSQA